MAVQSGQFFGLLGWKEMTGFFRISGGGGFSLEKEQIFGVLVAFIAPFGLICLDCVGVLT